MSTHLSDLSFPGDATRSMNINRKSMVKHLVMFKLAQEAEGRLKAENAVLVKEMLEALKPVIPVIRKIEVFVNLADASSDHYDILLESDFETMDDLKAYAGHPAHLQVGAFIAKVRTGRAVIDYNY